MAEETNQVEAQATEIGWLPQEQFKGPPDKWVDAKTFLERGQTYVPFLRKTVKEREAELGAVKGELQQIKNTLKQSQDQIAALTETTSKEAIARVKARVAELPAEIKAAREEGDIELETELTDELRASKEAIAKPAETKKAPTETAPVQPQMDPELIVWAAERDWFGKDHIRSQAMLGAARQLREEGDTSKGAAFYDKAEAKMKEALGLGDDNRRRTPDKVAGDVRGSANGGGGNGGGKTYTDLPPAAKEICERQAARLVGQDKRFKDIKDWRTHYASKYFEGE